MANVLRHVTFRTQSCELQFRHKSINPWTKYYMGSENGGASSDWGKDAIRCL